MMDEERVQGELFFLYIVPGRYLEKSRSGEGKEDEKREVDGELFFFWKLSCSSFRCSGYIGEYEWKREAERERETDEKKENGK